MPRESSRIKYFLIIIVLIGLGLVFRLFQKQILEHSYYIALAQQQHQTIQELPAHRGKIFGQTRYGGETVLATNQTFYSLLAVPRQIEDKDRTAAALSQRIDLSKSQLLEKINNDLPYIPPLAEKLSYQQAQEIAGENLKGIYLVANDYRFYPEKYLACYITGYLNRDGDGQYGIEQFYDQILKGDVGLIRAHQDVYGRYISVYEKQQPSDGWDLILTVDLTLQHKADQVIAEAVERYQAESGSIIIINPKNGDILAMAHSRKYDPNNYSREAEQKGVELFLDPTISEVYEPGSILKPITMASALDADVVDPETSRYFPASVKVDGNEIWNSAKKAYGEETMVEVLENSDNVGMVWVQQKLGKKKLHHYLEKFGFGALTGVDLEGEVCGSLLSYPDQYRDIDAASNAFGQAISVTPLQMITSYTPFINQGRLVQPHILDKKIDPNSGKEEKFRVNRTEPIISQQAADEISQMLVSVVDNGQANLARIEGYRIAGKTGTAQVPDGSGYSETETIHSFIGFAPADDPVFLMLVKLNRPKAVRWASLSAGPTFKQMAEFIFNYYQIKPEG